MRPRHICNKCFGLCVRSKVKKMPSLSSKSSTQLFSTDVDKANPRNVPTSWRTIARQHGGLKDVSLRRPNLSADTDTSALKISMLTHHHFSTIPAPVYTTGTMARACVRADILHLVGSTQSCIPIQHFRLFLEASEIPVQEEPCLLHRKYL